MNNSIIANATSFVGKLIIASTTAVSTPSYVPFFNLNNSRSYTIYADESKGNQIDFKLVQNINRLNEFESLRLENDVTIPKNLINTVISVLSKLGSRQPEIFPTAGGNIQIEYENKDKYLEVEFTPDGLMSVYKYDDKGNEYEDSSFYEVDQNIIEKEVAWFYE